MKIIKLLQNGEPASAGPRVRPADSFPTRMEIRPAPDEIAVRAYFIYLKQGSPQGCDVQHWLAAEAQAMST